MLSLLLALLAVLDPPVAPPPLLRALPASYVGAAAAPGACAGPLAADYGVIARVDEPTPALLARLSDEGGRVGGCGAPSPRILGRLGMPPELRTVAPQIDDAALQAARALPDLSAQRCVTRKTLRPYASLVLLAGPLTGFAIELAPGRNVVTARLIDARKSPATVHLLGKIGARTLEWCDRTDVAEGHCPNPTHGETRHVTLVDDYLVLTLGLGFADVCGQDDLILRAFPLPAAVRRSLTSP